MLHNNGNDSNLNASGLQDPISSSTVDPLSLSSRSSSPTGATGSTMMKYYFTYQYNIADDITITADAAANADYYTGYFIEDSATYKIGGNPVGVGSLYDHNPNTNEVNFNGGYKITAIIAANSGDQKGAITVDSYYDYDSTAQKYTQVKPFEVSGNAGLGSEIGYLTDKKDSTNDRFGGDYYEATYTSGGGSINTKTKLYTFTYTYGTGGDFYTGYTIDEAGKYGVAATEKDTDPMKGSLNISYDPYKGKDELGSTDSKYTITGVYSVSDSFGKHIGQVHVDRYHDNGNKWGVKPYEVNSGGKGLGSEYGLLTGVYGDDIEGAVKNDLFGYDYFAADKKSLQLYQYTYKFDGANGDTYTGFTVDVSDKYPTTTSYDSPLYKGNNEIGKAGMYEVKVINDKLDNSFAQYRGQVSIESYFDSETKQTLKPSMVNAGGKGLGSEYGLLTGSYGDDVKGAVKYDLFGYDYFEADTSEIVTTNVAVYQFTYQYNRADSNNTYSKDYYKGYVIDIDGKYTEGEAYNLSDVPNKTGEKGSYIIGKKTLLGSTDSNRIGEVVVQSYYDQEKAYTYDSTTNPKFDGGSGTSGLGSESGYLTDARNEQYDKFGEQMYEADIDRVTTPA